MPASGGSASRSIIRDGATVIDLKTNWAPRLGFAWDFARNGRSKVFAGYGRFYESIPLDMDIRSFGGEVSCACFNFDPDPHDFTPDPAAPRQSRVNSSIEPVDQNLRGQYINEFVGGAEYEVAPNVTVGVKDVHRDLARVIEDFLIRPRSTYFIANPGEGLGKAMAFYCVHSDCGPGNDGTVAAPKATAHERQHRDYRPEGASPTNWQLLASYVWSRLEGNYDGTYQNLHGAAGSERQLGLRLRGLHGECRREADQRPRPSAQAGCQLRVLEEPAHKG